MNRRFFLRVASGLAAGSALVTKTATANEIDESDRDEFPWFPFGLRVSPPDGNEAIPDFVTPTSSPPSDYHTISGGSTGNQWLASTCSAWAATNAMSIGLARSKGRSDVLADDLFDVDSVYNGAKKRVGRCSDDAFSMADTFEFTKLVGAPSRSWPIGYRCDDARPLEIAFANATKTTAYGRFFSFYNDVNRREKDFADLEKVVSAGFPVVCSIMMFPGFGMSAFGKGYFADRDLADKYINPVRPALGAHAIVVTGYTSNAVRIWNSFGRFWGRDGFAWVEKSLFFKVLVEGWVLKV